MLTKSLNYGLLQFQAWICIIFQSFFMKFKDQNHFLNYICFIFIHLANKSFPNTVKTLATKQIINLT